MPETPMTVVETAEFIRRSTRLMADGDREEVVAFVAANPDAGDVIPETGGIRKIRWAREGMGKRGGVRVIYYYRNERIPVFLLSVYAKNEKANLGRAERKAMKRLIAVLVAEYPRKA